ncbi:hypothetical protein Micbo1qcDRAFT_25620 [Microdochium bolleyi]|uniref:Secreted protein n=1 Tax=Microdochium bolleyi TaxID=196109 RepID=A0A136JDW8_9PEZI|nr:hypothetical protein Micbo1qcDRAFT_25620 [Microdochium bolleyi]
MRKNTSCVLLLRPVLLIPWCGKEPSPTLDLIHCVDAETVSSSMMQVAACALKEKQKRSCDKTVEPLNAGTLRVGMPHFRCGEGDHDGV